MGFVTTDWVFALVSGLPSLTYALVISSLTVFLTPVLRRLWAKMAGAAVLAGSTTLAIRPALGILFAPVAEGGGASRLSGGICVCHGWQVLIPAYITYAEPVIACMCIALLVWDA